MRTIDLMYPSCLTGRNEKLLTGKTTPGSAQSPAEKELNKSTKPKKFHSQPIILFFFFFFFYGLETKFLIRICANVVCTCTGYNRIVCRLQGEK